MTLAQSASLTPEQLRVAVAERLGWTRHSVSKADPFVCDKCGMHYCRSVWKSWEIPYLWCKKDGLENPPNYPESLDACHEFEKTLGAYNDPRRRRYDAKLELICGDDFWEHKTHWSPDPINANATQRCRAFLAVTENRNE